MTDRSHFVLGTPVTGGAFFGRHEELATIGRALRDGKSVNFYSVRRIGKTSLLRQVEYLCQTSELWKAYRPVFLDLEFRDESLAYQLLRCCNYRGASLGIERAWEYLRRLIRHSSEQRLLLLDEVSGWLHKAIDPKDQVGLYSLQREGLLAMVASTVTKPLVEQTDLISKTEIQAFPLGTFRPEEALDLLITLWDRSGLNPEYELAQELARYVGYNPCLVQIIGHAAEFRIRSGLWIGVKELMEEWLDGWGRSWLIEVMRPFVADEEEMDWELLFWRARAYGLVIDGAAGMCVAPFLRDFLANNDQALQLLYGMIEIENQGRRSNE